MRVPTPEEPLRVVELFSGIGAQAMALKEAGIPHVIVGTSEIDANAMRSYEAIHGPVPQLGDITELEHLPGCDLVTYSFPCLTGDTAVLTSKGWVPIREVEVGDCVYSPDGGYHRVSAAGCTGTKPTRVLKVEGLPPVRCTDDHPFRARRDGAWAWTYARSIAAGDVIRGISMESADGNPVYTDLRVMSSEPTGYDERVYDITVERTESFYVGGGLESHNCQDLSIAGGQRGMERGSGTRSALLWEVGRLIEDACRRGEAPECLLMENVPAILNRKNKGAFSEWIHYLSDLGYTSSYAVLNATDFDVPQNRKRCFMVSTTDGSRFRFPEGHPTERRLRDVLESDVDESYYLSDEKIARYEEHKRRHDAQGHGLGWEPRTPDDSARPLTALPSRNSQTFLVVQGSLEEYRAERGDGAGDTVVEPTSEAPAEDLEHGMEYGMEHGMRSGTWNGDGDVQIPGTGPSDYMDYGLEHGLEHGTNPGTTDPARCHVVGRIDGMREQPGRVHSPDGYGPTVMANTYGYPASLVIEDAAGIDVVGRIDDPSRHESANRIYGTDGVSPTVVTGSGGGHMPKIAVRAPEGPSIRLTGMIREDGYRYVNKVYGAEGVSPTILGNDRVNNVPKVDVSEGGVADE